MDAISGVFKTKTGTELNKFFVNCMIGQKKIKFKQGLITRQSEINDDNEQEFEVQFCLCKLEK